MVKDLSDGASVVVVVVVVVVVDVVFVGLAVRGADPFMYTDFFL